jgi:hypothetical protein
MRRQIPQPLDRLRRLQPRSDQSRRGFFLPQHPPHLLAAPCATPGGPDPAGVQLRRDLLEGDNTGGPQLRDDRNKVCRAAPGLGLACRQADDPALVANNRQVARLPPSFCPRGLAAARASLVRREIMRRSSSATMAMIPTVRRLALGMSAATNSTPAFSSPSRKCASRLRRSSLAMMRVALCSRAQAQRLGQLGPVGALAALDLDHFSDELPVPAAQIGTHGFLLCLEARPERPCSSVLTR